MVHLTHGSLACGAAGLWKLALNFQSSCIGQRNYRPPPGMDTWTAGVAGQWPARGACAEAGAPRAGEMDLDDFPDSAKPPGIAVSEIAARFVTNVV